MRRLAFLALWLTSPIPAPAESAGNRLAYLDDPNPFHVGLHFPKLATPQWVGDPRVEAVVTLGIDDLRQTAPYEAFLRPILTRLQRIDGRAPVSIFCNAFDPDDPRFQAWLDEGLSLEVHTLAHPCPILAKGDFAAAETTFHGGVDLLARIPGNTPVAFRTPCCDSINSPSPRVFHELFARSSPEGRFLRMDSSVVVLLTTNHPALPRDLVLDPEGHHRFTRYLPFPNFVTTVENYPYPWIVAGVGWEFPCLAPSDWQGQRLRGNAHPQTLADWQAALEAVVRLQGVFNFVFHPHGWSSPAQFVEFIDHARTVHGPRVLFLTYPEALDRLTRHLGAGQPLRADDGGDNGIRLLDLNRDGFLDVLIGNPDLRLTRVWNPASRSWTDSPLPFTLVDHASPGPRRPTGVRFAVLHPDGRPSALVRTRDHAGAWTFDGTRWNAEPAFLRGLELDGQPILTMDEGRDRGVRFRDVTRDGRCELIVANPDQSGILLWDPDHQAWQSSGLALPPVVTMVDAQGRDDGVRFADVNDDGHPDLFHSNAFRFGLWLWQPENPLGLTAGWSREVTAGTRATPVGTATPAPAIPIHEIPAFVRTGLRPDNGAWFHSRHLWVQNEDTAHLPDLVDRRAFDDLLRSNAAPPSDPGEAHAAPLKESDPVP